MDRRGFFRQVLGRGLHHGAGQVDAALAPLARAAEAARTTLPEAFGDAPGDEAAASSAAEAEADADAAGSATASPPVAAPARACTRADALGIVADAGLERPAAAIGPLVTRSLRLVPALGAGGGGAGSAGVEPGDVRAGAGGGGAGGARSRAGGVPDLPAGTAWPQWNGRPLTFLAQLDLAAVAAAPALPGDGLLLVFAALGAVPGGERPEDSGAVRVLLVEREAADEDAEGAPHRASAAARPARPTAPVPLALAPEWTLPHADAPQVRALGLDAYERERWQQARMRLAERQGAALEQPGTPHALHRLLGDPDERGGGMPLACELAAADIEQPADRAGRPPADDCRARSARWRLLLQLTADARLGWSWGGGERLYVWIDGDELAAGLLTRVRAFAR